MWLIWRFQVFWVCLLIGWCSIILFGFYERVGFSQRSVCVDRNDDFSLLFTIIMMFNVPFNNFTTGSSRLMFGRALRMVT